MLSCLVLSLFLAEVVDLREKLAKSETYRSHAEVALHTVQDKLRAVSARKLDAFVTVRRGRGEERGG